MLFDSPEFNKLVEQDEQLLSKGKIDWESKLLTIAKEIMECQNVLSVTDIPDTPFILKNDIDEPTEEERERILTERTEESKKQWLAQKARYKRKLTSAKERLEELINRIADKEHNNAVESFANDIKNWKEHKLTAEEKERNDKIIHDNWLLARAEFCSQLSNCDDTKAVIKEAEGLEYKKPFPEQYPWKDVALSMLKFPERVTFDYDVCPDCGEARIKIYFHSPECTWDMMCGVGGNMVICPHCKIQAEFNETMRN